MDVLHDMHTGRRLPLARSPVRVGRDPDNDVVVGGREVSRHHCELRKGIFGGWTLKQLGSPDAAGAGFNCTFVKRADEILHVLPGKKPLKLEGWDRIALGRKHEDADLDFRFEYYRSSS